MSGRDDVKLKLAEFRQQLETDASRRADNQAKTIRELHEKLAEKDRAIRHLENRCYVLTRGTICLFCGYKDRCSAKQKISK